MTRGGRRGRPEPDRRLRRRGADARPSNWRRFQQALHSRKVAKTETDNKTTRMVKKPTAFYNGQAPPLEMQPCTLVELEAGQCHWPLGEMQQVAVMFCGGAAVPGRRYCAHHLRRASSRHA